MYDDDFLDRLLNSSGDDLDRLIQYDRDRSRRRHPYRDIQVDMSDIEQILSSRPPTTVGHNDSVVSVTSSGTNFPDLSEECFRQVYEQLVAEDYCIDRVSAVRKGSQRSVYRQVASMVLRTILVVVGMCICLGGAIWFSQVLLSIFPL